MKIAITGPLGHIGSKLIHSFKKNEFKEVRLIDNLMTQRYASLFNLPRGVNFNFFEDDICTANLDRYFKDIDIVIHLAAITDAAASFHKADMVEKVNFYGARRVIKACLRNRSKLIFPSTTSVYGSQQEVVDEGCLELEPQSPYAESKLKTERFLIDLGRKSNLKFIICRLGTIFGISVGMRFHTAVNKFVWQACMAQTITVWRTAMHQKRPYLDINDAVRSIKFILKEDLFDNQVYNVVSINSTVADILHLTKKFIPNIKVNYVDSKIMNQLTYTALNNKFKQAGFKFRGDIEKGIRESIGLLKAAKNGGDIVYAQRV